MNSTAHKLIYVAVVLMLVTAAWGLEYFYLTDTEIERFGFTVRFQSGDTLWGPVHSNWQIAIMGNPVFYDVVTTTASDFWRGAGYSPQFHGPDPIFNAPEVLLPDDAPLLRMEAQRQGHFFDHGFSRTMLMELRLNSARLYEWRTGCPIDCTDFTDVALSNGFNAFYFNCPLRIHGVLRGELSIGSSYDVRIEDDLRYEDSDARGRVPEGSTNILSLVSLRDIKIANSPANGRENCNGGGRYNPNQDFCGVIVCGAMYALGESFTFENQNDGGDSGYVCNCNPDERGFVHLFGATIQYRRGFMHRSSQGGTGYLKDYYWDTRLREWDDLIWPEPPPPVTDTLNFGDVFVDHTATMTAIYPGYGVIPGFVNYPFQVQQYYQRPETTFIPVTFTPPSIQSFSAVLPLTVNFETFHVILLGRGIEDTTSAPGIVNVDGGIK